jgi:hypothetical protein
MTLAEALNTSPYHAAHRFTADGEWWCYIMGDTEIFCDEQTEGATYRVVDASEGKRFDDWQPLYWPYRVH